MLKTMSVLAMCLSLSCSAAAALTGGEINALFREGSEMFRQGNERVGKEPEAARELYGNALMRFERIAREGGIRNGKLYYNIGNCYFRMENLGMAIVYYRRALQYVPNDPNLHQNLEYARSKRLDKVEVKQTTRVMNTLFFWHYDLSTKTRSVLFISFFILLWTCALVRVFVPRPFLAWIAGISALLSALFLGSLLTEAAGTARENPGVVVANEVLARKGDGEAFEPSFKETLHAGMEFDLMEKRTGWCQIELADGRQCWVPSGSVELIR